MKVKVLIVGMLMLLSALTSIAQTTLDYDIRKIGSSTYKVIKPTFNNLKAIVNCSSNQFETMMKQYGYWKSRDSYPTDYSYVVYDNNSTDLYLYGNQGLGINYVEKSESKKHALIRGKMSQLFPKGSLSDLRLELYSYKVRESDNEKFIVKDEQGGQYVIELEFSNGNYKIGIVHSTNVNDNFSSNSNVYQSNSNFTDSQVVTSVIGLNFETKFYASEYYLANRFGHSYGTTGNSQLRFYDIMVGGMTYENAEFYFKNSKFIAARFYTGFPLSKLNDAKSFRDRIIARYKEKYWYNKPYTSNGFQCYAFGKSMYPNYKYYPIYVILQKADSNDGVMMYWVECLYYMELLTHDDDDI